jgi:hypothetical protein
MNYGTSSIYPFDIGYVDTSNWKDLAGCFKTPFSKKEICMRYMGNYTYMVEIPDDFISYFNIAGTTMIVRLIQRLDGTIYFTDAVSNEGKLFHSLKVEIGPYGIKFSSNDGYDVMIAFKYDEDLIDYMNSQSFLKVFSKSFRL